MNFSYGTVVKIQREQTETDIQKLLSDVRSTGMNTVVVWPAVYWWEDKTKPGYPYNTGRMILEYAHKIGLKIIMETAGQQTTLEYAPDFVMKQKYLPLKKNGEIEYRGADYGFLNYFHPEVNSLVEKHLVEITTAYKEYPALYGYDIFNETMYASYDRYTLEVFRIWLKEKYGSIDKLNDVWDHVYFNWSQIEFSPWTWLSVMPNVDYKQFHKSEMGIILKKWTQIVKSIDPNHPVIADNLFSMLQRDNTPYRAQDEWNVAESIDELGLSYYPKASVPGMPPHKRWQIMSGFNSASSSGRFWVSELQTHFQSFFNQSNVVSSDELKTWTWETIAGGALGVIYWKWHPFTKGIQTGGRGLVGYKGQFNDRTKAVGEVATVLNGHLEAFGNCKPEEAKVAILFDTLSLDFYRAYSESYSQAAQNIYHESIEGLYKLLWNNNVPVSYVNPGQVINGAVWKYKALFLSNQLSISDELAQAIKAYVAQGGLLIIDGKSGYIDEQGILSKTIPGCSLNAAIGCDLVDIDPACPDITLTLEAGQKVVLPSYYERQIVEIYPDEQHVKVLGTFPDGTPGMISKQVGAGQVIFIPTYLWYGYFHQGGEGIEFFLNTLIDRYGFRTFKATGDVRVKVTQSDLEKLVYIFNYSGQAQHSRIFLPGLAGTEVVTEWLGQTGVQTQKSPEGLEIVTEIPAGGMAIYRIGLA